MQRNKENKFENISMNSKQSKMWARFQEVEIDLQQGKKSEILLLTKSVMQWLYTRLVLFYLNLLLNSQEYCTKKQHNFFFLCQKKNQKNKKLMSTICPLQPSSNLKAQLQAKVLFFFYGQKQIAVRFCAMGNLSNGDTKQTHIFSSMRNVLLPSMRQQNWS